MELVQKITKMEKMLILSVAESERVISDVQCLVKDNERKRLIEKEREKDLVILSRHFERETQVQNLI